MKTSSYIFTPATAQLIGGPGLVSPSTLNRWSHADECSQRDEECVSSNVAGLYGPEVAYLRCAVCNEDKAGYF
jgi:hypothetical protein